MAGKLFFSIFENFLRLGTAAYADISSPAWINLRLLIDVVRARAKRAAPMTIKNPMTNLCLRINVFLLDSLARRRDGPVPPSIDVIFMMRDRAATLEHRI
jgi:hypothetical protein